MPASSLVDIAIKVCIKNIRSLTDVGDFEYWKIQPVLARVQNPEQLHEIEENSPQIKGEDADLWRAFIARDIPNWQTKNYCPKNPTKWYEVYGKYKREQRQEIQRDEEILRNTMLGIKKEREGHVSKVVDLRTLPKIPKDPRMLANNGGVPLHKKGFSKPSTFNFTAGSKTKMTDAKSVLTRAKREAKEISRMSKLSTPTHKLIGRKSQVMRAPAGMVTEHINAAKPALRILSRRKSGVAFGRAGGGGGNVSASALEEREARLRALTMGGGAGSKRDSSGAVKPTMVSSSDEEDEDEDDDDLFDDSVSKLRAPPSSRPISSSSSSRPRPPQSSSSPPGSKPSDVISSLISKPKSIPQPQSSAPSASSSPQSKPQSGSPAPGGGGGGGGVSKPMMARKKVPVDIFNRGAKKPRVR